MYIGEKRGSLQPVIDTFVAHRRYLENYYAAIPNSFSADDHHEAIHWPIHASLAGEETSHLFPFRAKLVRTCKQAGVEHLQAYADGFAQWPMTAGQRKSGALVSADGKVIWCSQHCVLARLLNSALLLLRCMCVCRSW